MSENYDFHFNAAVDWLEESSRRNSIAAGNECVATAQVHALLAVADAIQTFSASYNGWKDLGK